MPNIKKVVAIVGPTSSGKTAWAKILAQKFNGKVISADSRQIYKKMDIGTGKDKSYYQDLIDIIEPIKKFSVWDYQRMANNLINRYLSMKSLPILVGGTGLYLYAVLYGYVLPGLKEKSLELRENLEKLSVDKLYKKLEKIDPLSANKIDSLNKRRIIRALEVSILAKKPFSQLKKKAKPAFETLVIGIDVDRATLYARIDARIDEMIKKGLVEEVRNLVEEFGEDTPALNSIGYKEILDYFRGRHTLKDAIQKIKFNSHAFARRQLTWFRKDKKIHWVKNIDQAERLIKKFLSN